MNMARCEIYSKRRISAVCQRRGGAEMFMKLKCFGKKEALREIFLCLLHKHTWHKKRSQRISARSHACARAPTQHARAHTQQTICDAELHKGHLLWRNYWSPNALTKSINYSPTKKPISNKNRARSVVRVPPQLQQLRPQIIRCAVKERQ